MSHVNEVEVHVLEARPPCRIYAKIRRWVWSIWWRCVVELSLAETYWYFTLLDAVLPARCA